MLSKSYFYSFNCMFEMALMMKNNWYGKQHFIWVSVDDFERNNDECIAIYNYWQEQEKQLQDIIKEDVNRGRLLQSDLEKIKLILKYFPDAWEIIKWTNTLSFEEVAANQFYKLLAFIRNELMIGDSVADVPNTDVPMDVGLVPKGIAIVQNGNKSVVQTVVGGAVTINM